MSLRSLRLERNVKQEDLAAYIGVSPSMISRYERGLSVPPADKAVKMAEYLNTSVDAVMGHENTGNDVADSAGDPVRSRDFSYRTVSDDKLLVVSSKEEQEALSMANGTCELCGTTFPQKNFLETHFVVWLKDGGTPTLDNTVALCPNCHKLVHLAPDPATTDKLLRIAKSHLKP